ncbi:MAG: hypothetical protein HY270_14415 [Deltaproteobacteria bacterium]|nr:hypothetical protein [Deltaproteobacteria bacterium]
MLETLSPWWRRILSSAGYTALVALVAALGYLTFRATNERRSSPQGAADTVNENETLPLVQFDSFSSRFERSSDGERINVSLRLRSTAPGSLECQVYVVARNDVDSPKVWGVWPSQGPEGAVTAGGHFRGNTNSGERVTLTSSWVRISAPIVHPLGLPPFETAVVYVVGPKGDVLLARPFSLN